MDIQIRGATAADAAEAVDALRRSIAELCVADHQHDPTELEGWLGNKTVAGWQQWIARDDAMVLVAERDSKIVGVGMATLGGEILLNYVHPEARFGGVSKAILAAIEAKLRLQDVQRCQLESTVTARSFYERRGFHSEVEGSRILTKPL
ncbi:GNAT family N-acetyltransferase [Paracoccus indicus]|uniref:GNAT family N-acetyltransferase n=1 Tax=Paracoccus indicus TaxID=2079229 RepID=UPI000D3BA75E|nr:GNAT family N-acetyltransferase [Paracoccus indicus]